MKPKEIRISRKYADAIFEIAVQNNMLKQIKDDFNFLLSSLSENPSFNMLFLNPCMSTEEKIKFFKSAFDGRISEIFMNFMGLVIFKKRTHLLAEMFSSFSALEDEKNGICRGVVKSAVKLEEGKKTSLEAMLSLKYKKTVKLKQQVDPSIIAGLVINIRDKYIDASINGYLNRMKEELMLWK